MDQNYPLFLTVHVRTVHNSTSGHEASQPLYLTLALQLALLPDPSLPQTCINCQGVIMRLHALLLHKTWWSACTHYTLHDIIAV